MPPGDVAKLSAPRNKKAPQRQGFFRFRNRYAARGNWGALASMGSLVGSSYLTQSSIYRKAVHAFPIPL
jgi:hypothetical protein